MRLLRWRAAAVIAGAFIFGAYFYASGITKAVIQVDFGPAPFLEGATVLVDGDSAGVLFRRGRRRLTGFRVKVGEHTVQVVHDEYRGLPATVDADLRGAQYVLWAFPDSRRTDDGYERIIELRDSPP